MDCCSCQHSIGKRDALCRDVGMASPVDLVNTHRQTLGSCRKVQSFKGGDCEGLGCRIKTQRRFDLAERLARALGVDHGDALCDHNRQINAARVGGVGHRAAKLCNLN